MTATPAAAADTPPSPPPVHAAVFEKLDPMHRRFFRYGPVGPYYPELAARRGVTGEAVLECRTIDRGRLVDCAIISETPPGYFFGAASMRMAGGGLVHAEETAPEGQIIRVRVPFTITERGP